jgi:hypothetical protein
MAVMKTERHHMTLDSQNEYERKWLEKVTDSEGYILADALMACAGNYVFIVGSHYKKHSTDVKELLLPIIKGKAFRTVAKSGTGKLSSSCKCHAAKGAKGGVR